MTKQNGRTMNPKTPRINKVGCILGPQSAETDKYLVHLGLDALRAYAEPQRAHVSDVLPELVLTLPTPEIRSSAGFSFWHPNIGCAQTSEARSAADDWNYQQDDGICDEVFPNVKLPSSSLNDCAEVRNELRCSTGTDAFTLWASRFAAGNSPSNDVVAQCYGELVSPMSPIVFAITNSQNWSANPPDLDRQTGRQKVAATLSRLRANFYRLGRFVLGDVRRWDSVSTKQKNVPSMQNVFGRKAPWHLRRLSRIWSPAQSEQYPSQHMNRASDMTCEEPNRRNTLV